MLERYIRLYLLSVSFLTLALGAIPTDAQGVVPEVVETSVFPDAPEPGLPQVAGVQQNPLAANTVQPTGPGTISGTVLDTNGSVVQGAHIRLSGTAQRSAESGGSGEFSFAGLPPGTYKLTVTGTDMSTFVSSPVVLHEGEARLVPKIVLGIAATTASVTVNGDKEELAEEQVHIAEQQRVLSVIPNFYSSYDWNAPPMLAKQKYKLIGRSLIDPVFFLEVAGIAGAEQYKGIFPAYGCCLEGYGKRYGAALANQAAGDFLGRAVFPSIFHQDPRYFYKGTGSAPSRALYAMSAAVITRGDSGRRMPNYSSILGNLAAGALSNLYYPEEDRGVRLTFLNGLGATGATAVGNLIREFILKDLTSRAKGTGSQP